MQKRGKGVEITVRDHGGSAPDEALARIFEAFFRAEGARTRCGGGYGPGLAIARSLIELHGGQIRAAHAPGGGLKITVRFVSLL